MPKNLVSRSAAIIFVAVFSVAAQPMDSRAVIARTQQDLIRSLEFERKHKGKEISRYDNAQHHLSDFDKEVTRGHWDKGKLDDAIEDVKNLVDHNTLDPDLRDALTADLRDLRVLRAEHDH